MTLQLKQLNNYERELLSKSSRLILCDIAASNLERPLPDVEADWEEIFQATGRNGLLGLTYRYLKYGYSRDIPPSEFRQSVQKAYRLSALKTAQMYRKINPVLNELTKSGIEYLVVKGPILGHLVYSEPTLRSFNDLDIVVRERDWSAMHQQLLKIGFIADHSLPAPPPKLAPGDIIYELKYWHRESRLLVEVHYDDLLNAGLASRDIEAFWQRAITTEIDGVSVKALSLEDQLIHLAMHAHYHGYTRLNWFSDIALLIQRYQNSLDWDQFCQTVHAEEAEVGVYYTFYYLSLMMGVTVPTEVFDQVCPDPFRRWWHDYYFPTSKIISLEPMYRADFSFYFTPLFKRLIPDLLVMGRRREKFHYLARLTFPSRSWLAHYYKLQDPKQITLHRILHLFKLTYHYLSEVAKKTTGMPLDTKRKSK
ncbi:nucleotidyltransferase family protein [Anaerolineales bacterium HSG24]|nr:nucleotidyltransferase family protein [Anaerolineales bacterium HSG24]